MAPRISTRERRRPVPTRTAGATVSVVVPCFNYGRYLRDAVTSALCQEDVVVEVIVVDDASTDASLAVAAALAAEDARVRVLRHRTNMGPVATFNDGLALAGGEFLVRLDADDLLTPGSLRRAVALARRYPSVGLVYGHPLHFTGRTPLPTAARSEATSWTVWPGLNWLKLRCRSATNVITSPEVLMRRSVVDIVGGQRELAHTHDFEMWMRLAAHSDVGYVGGCDQAFHRDHPGSLSEQLDWHRGADGYRELRRAFETLLVDARSEIPDAEALMATASRRLAEDAVAAAAHEYDCGRVDDVVTASYVDFALDTWPAVVAGPQWRSLERRRRTGGRWARTHPWVVGLRAAGRIRREITFRRWHRWGIYERA